MEKTTNATFIGLSFNKHDFFYLLISFYFDIKHVLCLTSCRHDIAEILLKVALSTKNQSINLTS